MFIRTRMRNGRSSRSRRSRHNKSGQRLVRTLRMESLEGREMLAISPQALLPDLTAWASQSKGFMYDWTIVGNELRLTSAMANIGTGALELRGGATHGDTQDVFQRVFEPNGSFTDVLAGTFTYHPEHGHIHFDGFAVFRLREFLPGGGVGAIVASGPKTSFCLLDVERYNTSGLGSPRYLTCGQVQGVSVGWADVYDRGLPGQSIEITNVPDGTYWLEAEVDPDNHLLESNEGNNVTRIQISLVRPPGPGPIPPDAFEPNNSFDTASILAPPEDHVYSGLSIHGSTNSDYYRVTASTSGTMAFRLAFTHSQGDIDMEVFNSARTRIGKSDSIQNSEQFSFQAVAGQFYFVRVYGYNGATNPNYTFSIDQPDGPGGILPDQFEDNDTVATAFNLLAADETYVNLNIDSVGDNDYYRIVPTTSGTMTVSLALTHAQGDIDLDILDASQTRLGRSDSTGNSEQLSISVTAGQAYYIRVFGYQNAVNPNYSMTVDVPTVGGPPVITYLSTTGGGTLASTDGSPSLSFADADILKLTVQSTGQHGYQLHFDGSDVGLSTSSEDIDAFAFLPDGSIVLSTAGSFSVPSAGGTAISGNGEDLLRFVPTTLGATTAGGWSMYFDGSDVGLSGTAENVDAIAVLTDGRLLFSTSDAFAVSGGVSGQDEDLISFTPTTLGAITAGTWSMYFDGSDVGLSTNSGEDLNGLHVRETGFLPTLYLSTVGAFSVTGLSGADEDAFAFTPSSLGSTTAGTFGPGLAFDGSLYGLSTFAVDGIHLAPQPSGAQALAQAAAESSNFTGNMSLRVYSASTTSSSKKVSQTSRTTSTPAAIDAALLAVVADSSSTAKSKSATSSSSCGCGQTSSPTSDSGKSHGEVRIQVATAISSTVSATRNR